MFIKLKFGKVTRKVKLSETDFDSIKKKTEELFGEQAKHCLFMYRDVDSEIVSIFGDEDMEACFEEAEEIGSNCITLILKENTEGIKNARSISKKRAVVNECDDSDTSSESLLEEIDYSAEKKEKNKIEEIMRIAINMADRKEKRREEKLKRKQRKKEEEKNQIMIKNIRQLDKKERRELQKMNDIRKSLIEEFKDDSVSFEKKKGMPEFVKCIIKQKKMWWKKNKDWWKKDNKDNWYKDNEGEWWKKVGESKPEFSNENKENFYENKHGVWWQKMVSWGVEEGPWKEHRKPWFKLNDLFFKEFKDEFKEFKRNPELIMKLFQKCGEKVKSIIRKNAKRVIEENSNLVEDGRERLEEFERCKEQHNSSGRQDNYRYKKHNGRRGHHGHRHHRNYRNHKGHCRQQDSTPLNEQVDQKYIDEKLKRIYEQFSYQNKDQLREEFLTGLENGAQFKDLVQKKRKQKKQIKIRVKIIMSALPHLNRRDIKPIVVADLLDGKDSNFTLNKFLLIQSEDSEENIDEIEVQKRVNTLVKIFPHIERKELRKEAIVDIKAGNGLKDTMKRLFA